jgi:hypothetical protein
MEIVLARSMKRESVMFVENPILLVEARLDSVPFLEERLNLAFFLYKKPFRPKRQAVLTGDAIMIILKK